MLWKILWFRLGLELANDLCRRSGEPFDEVLQFLSSGLIQPQHEACVIVARVMGPRSAPVGSLCVPAAWKVIRGHLPKRLAYPGRDRRTMGRGGLLYLLEEFRLQQHGDRRHRDDGRPIDGPSV